MTIEQWRAAVTRWGDPLLGLALLLANRRAPAEAATIATFASVLGADGPGELEHALYSSLFHRLTRRRLPTMPRRGVLSRELARIAPLDRFVLGLWLLRGLDGQQIAAIIGRAPQQVVERLERVMVRSAREPPASAEEGHLTLHHWLAEQLSISEPPAHHSRTCQACQAAQSSWQAARDDVRVRLRGAVGQAHLSPAAQEAIEAELTAQEDEPPAWWQLRGVWLAALVAGVGLALTLMVVPRGSVTTAPSPPPLEARALVRGALRNWLLSEQAGTLHQQVWARDPRLHDGEPVVTYLWLAGLGSTRHRVEVRRGGQLVEWQIGDGRSQLDYAAEPADSSCRWNTGWSGNYDKFLRGPQHFSVSADEQRQARDTRLIQGTYGLGYLELQRALAASDLRSFGAQLEGDRRIVLLQFTDPSREPARQVVLRIDPLAQQLQAVQEVQVLGTHAHSTDLWRLELSTVVPGDVPLAIPTGPASVGRERLVDVGCPGLDPRYVVSPRALLYSTRPAYVPAQLPPGIERLVLLANDQVGLGSGRMGRGRNGDVTLLIAGPARWLSLRDGQPAPDDESKQLTVGNWKISLNGPNSDGIWNGRLHSSGDGGGDLGPVSTFWARGWTRAELLALLHSFVPFDGTTWLTLDAAFLDTRPLAPEVADAVRRTLQALQPTPNTAVELRTTTKVRVQPRAAEPPDPYHIPVAQRFPAMLIRHQLLQFDGTHIAAYHDRRTLPDGTVYELRQVTNSRFDWYSNSQGITYTGPGVLLGRFVRPEQADTEMLTALFAEDISITLSTAFGYVLLEQALRAPPADDQGFVGPGAPQTPWYGDMPLGQWVRQLYLDSNSYRPVIATIAHRRPDGNETYLQEIRITERRELESLPADAFSLESLPQGAFTIDVGHGSEAVVETIEEPGRLLRLPATAGLQISDTTTVPWTPLSGRGISINSGWQQLTGLSGTTTTTYRSDPAVVVRVTQGPAAVLRHVLRHQPVPHGSDAGAPWSGSERLRVDIAGQARDAWLLTDQSAAVLVVEVDELLLHLSGPADYLVGPLLALLPLLEWTEQ